VGEEAPMFSLLAGLFSWLFSKTEIQILIIGLDHAGKTTLLEQVRECMAVFVSLLTPADERNISKGRA